MGSAVFVMGFLLCIMHNQARDIPRTLQRCIKKHDANLMKIWIIGWVVNEVPSIILVICFQVRQIISDFSVTAAIILMSLTDYFLGLDTPKLNVPAGLTPTIHDRSWVVKPFGKNPAWTAFAAIVPAVFAVILIFMDQQITAVIINRQENKLKKGAGYHLDLLILSLAVIFCAVLGLPWMVAATVLSINHVNSLKLESECKAPGEAPQFESVRENRLTTLLIYVLIGASVFMTPVLSVRSLLSCFVEITRNLKHGAFDFASHKEGETFKLVLPMSQFLPVAMVSFADSGITFLEAKAYEHKVRRLVSSLVFISAQFHLPIQPPHSNSLFQSR